MTGVVLGDFEHIIGMQFEGAVVVVCLDFHRVSVYIRMLPLSYPGKKSNIVCSICRLVPALGIHPQPLEARTMSLVGSTTS